TVPSASGFIEWGRVKIKLVTDPNKTWAPGGSSGTVECFCAVGTDISGNVLTLNKAIPEDYSETQTTGATIVQYEFGLLNGFGIENIIIDGTNATDMIVGLDVVGVADNCWIKNVHVVGHKNYGIAISMASKFLVEDC